MIVPGILVCISFLISVCMFILSKALLISSATLIVRAGGAIWLNPFAMVLFNMCSAVTVECCVLSPCYMGLLLCKEESSSPVSLQLQRRGIWACIYVFDGVGMGTMSASFHMCGIMLVLRLVFNMLARNASSRGPMCLWCMMFSLLGPCELLFIFSFIASWT